MKTVSLFSSYGLGDLGLRAAGADIVLMAELLEDRCAFLKRNFPDAEIVSGDLEEGWETAADRVEEMLGRESPYLLVATPPCQAMSTNGAGKLAAAVREGRRPELDPRNRLIIPALEVVKRLRPQWVVFENVPQMRNTLISVSPEGGPPLRKIVDIVREELEGLGYSGGWESVNFKRHGVPQDRPRLITVFGLGGPHDIKSLLPPPEPGEPATLKQVIGHFEKLDASEKLASAADALHRVRKMKDNYYWWVSRIPPSSGRTAYDNQCECGWISPTKSGKQTAKECPTYCGGCGALLPRPTVPVEKGTPDGKRRLISGFRTAYKRMEWGKPAPTVTMNLMTMSSDNKLHPEQNRTLSPAEAAAIQTVDRYLYDWGNASDRELCDALGEAVPPLFFERLLRRLASISDRTTPAGS